MKPFIAGNWKMNKLPSEAEAWASSFLKGLQHSPHDNVDIAICAPFTHLAGLSAVLVASPVKLGAQDLSAHASGAYTGEVAAAMLRDLGVHYVIIGHSERRAYHHEDDALVHAKVHAAMAAELVPIVCIGESLEQREADQAQAVTLGQLRAALEGVTLSEAKQLVIAYEPIWAIGTGKTATDDDAQEMCAAIRGALRELYPALADEVQLLYGGSMKPGNAAGLLAQADINGGLIGGASLQEKDMLELISAGQNA